MRYSALVRSQDIIFSCWPTGHTAARTLGFALVGSWMAACGTSGDGAALVAAEQRKLQPDEVVISRPIEEAVRHRSRPAEDLERDPSSKPAEVLAFLRISPGMTVLDLHAATGYFTELLAHVVGEEGHVIAHNHPGALTALPREAFERRYGNGRLGNVDQLFARHEEIDLPSSSLDAVLMSMVYHDTYWFAPNVDWGPVDQQDLLAELHDALKPGGVVVVVDHLAERGADPRRSAVATHRIDVGVVRRDFLRAGFVLDGESDLLRNPSDDYSVSVFDAAVLGRTDRFLMRFRRPE